MKYEKSEFLNTTTYTQGMDFTTAIGEIIKGRRVTRAAWKDSNIVVFLEKRLKISIKDKDIPLILTEGDMLADDWIII